MIDPEVMIRFQDRKGHRDDIVCSQEERTDDGKMARTVIDGIIDTAPVREQTTNGDVIEGDNGGQRQHAAEIPHTGVPGEGKTDTENVCDRGSPVTVEDGSAADPSEDPRAAGRIFDVAGGLRLECWIRRQESVHPGDDKTAPEHQAPAPCGPHFPSGAGQYTT